MAQRSTKDFGRDEFSSLLGVTGEREALDEVRAAAKPKKATVAQRHRDETRPRAYQELLLEETIIELRNRNYLAQREDQKQPPASRNEDAEDDQSEESFTANAQRRRRRPKTAPVLLSVKKDKAPDDGGESSSEEDNANGRRRKRNESNSSSSSSDDNDDEVDQRRQKLLSQRKKQVAQVVVNINATAAATTISTPAVSVTSEQALINDPVIPNRDKRARQASSSAEESSSSSTGSSSDSEDDEQDTPSVIRPVFIPKHQRNGVKNVAAISALSATNVKPVDERRIAESRAMIQQAVTTVKKEVANGIPSIDGVIGAMNDVPEDALDDPNVDRLDWVVRELERLLQSRDLEEARQNELADRERRRHLTDEERMAEDDAERRNATDQKMDRKNQRFFHKGAFYMDRSEWDDTDVRLKAAEYAAAVTGDDKHDRRHLPKVMQVKKFGFANQSKWKGLAKEDTSDKRMDMLPLNKNNNSKPKKM
jgi:microfibrillar-associated protein 1